MSDPASVNLSGLMDYVRKQFEEMRAMQAPPVPPKLDKSEDRDALGQRDVVGQAQKATMAPTVSKPGPSSQPHVPIPFEHTDQSVQNSLRLSLGTNFRFTPVPQFGANTYLPSFYMTHQILDVLNRKVFSVRKFYEASEFLDPILVHVYFQILEVVQTLKGQMQGQSVSTENEVFLSWFDQHFPSSTLPVPGPLVQSLKNLGASSPAIGSYNNIYPVLPDDSSATTQTLGVPTTAAATGALHALTGRIAPIPGLLDVYRRRIELANNSLALTPPQPGAVGNYNLAFRTVLGYQVLAGAENSFTGPYYRAPITAANHPTTNMFLVSPGVTTAPWMSAQASQSFMNNAPLAQAVFGEPSNVRTNDILSWQQFCCLTGDTTWFTETARLMTVYCKFVKGSTSLEAISPSGCMANHIAWICASGNIPQPATRYPANPRMTGNGYQYNLGVPEADINDSALYMQNIGAHHAGVPSAAGTFIRGPYFTTLPVLARTIGADPLAGAGPIISDMYVVEVPLK
ncbi:putative coat protein [Rhizoctonia solani partitivirus virus 5]|nr:putative coat protein [Rhizoctonia solani partitivirus virus 5]